MQDRKRPGHVEDTEGGGMVCMHCGGEVGGDGYSMGLGEAEEFEPMESAETDQHASTVEMREESFVNALGRRSHSAPRQQPKGDPKSVETVSGKSDDDEIKRMKAARYGVR